MGTLAFVMSLWMVQGDGRILRVGANVPEWKPLVVPAIEIYDGYSYLVACPKGSEHEIGNGYCSVGRWECADQTRILEHDQQQPPKYWCRAELQ